MAMAILDLPVQGVLTATNTTTEYDNLPDVALWQLLESIATQVVRTPENIATQRRLYAILEQRRLTGGHVSL